MQLIKTTLSGQSAESEVQPTELLLSEVKVVNVVLHKVVELACSLEDNWDSYGGLKPSSDAVKGAIFFSRLLLEDKPEIPYPDVFPVPNGNIQLEWSCNDIDLEIEILSGKKVLAYFEDYETKDTWEESFEFDFTKLTRALLLLEDRNTPRLRVA